MIDANEITKLVHEVVRLDGYELPAGATNEDCDGFARHRDYDAAGAQGVAAALQRNIRPGGFYGIPPLSRDFDTESILSLHPNWRDKGWIPIADDGCGNKYVVPTGAANLLKASPYYSSTLMRTVIFRPTLWRRA